jgi:hypothetical protein
MSGGDNHERKPKVYLLFPLLLWLEGSASIILIGTAPRIMIMAARNLHAIRVSSHFLRPASR